MVRRRYEEPEMRGKGRGTHMSSFPLVSRRYVPESVKAEKPADQDVKFGTNVKMGGPSSGIKVLGEASSSGKIWSGAMKGSVPHVC
jgi:hypothetical protein